MSEILTQTPLWKPRRISIEDLLIKEDQLLPDLTKAHASSPQTSQSSYTYTKPPLQRKVNNNNTPKCSSFCVEKDHILKRSPILILPTPTNSNLHGFPKSTRPMKRQRRGPSCDLCRSKKMKCDAVVEVLTHDKAPGFPQNLKLDSDDKRVLNDDVIHKYLTKKEIQDGYQVLYSREKLIKFRGCTYCENRCSSCEFHRGYTKDEILVYNILNR